MIKTILKSEITRFIIFASLGAFAAFYIYAVTNVLFTPPTKKAEISQGRAFEDLTTK